MFKYDREHDFDVILEQVVPCYKLMWVCRKYLNDVARQVETSNKSPFFVARQIDFVSRHNVFVAWRLNFTMTVKLIDTATDTFLV